MREYLNAISLVKNSRGVWDFDTSKGCSSGLAHNPKGCYGDCYAANNAARYGIDFNKTVLRDFENEKHRYSIINQISRIDMPFIRIGVTGDPSENWDHTLNICEKILPARMVLYKTYAKAIVIITKHWKSLTKTQLLRLSKLDVCVNTSVSALDRSALLTNRLRQYNRLKPYCRSVLRIVSCSFNLKNKTGVRLNVIQDKLFNNGNVIDTVLRVSQQNDFVLNGIINVEKVKFMDKLTLASVLNKKTFLGKCDKCPEMCGLNLFE